MSKPEWAEKSLNELKWAQILIKFLPVMHDQCYVMIMSWLVKRHKCQK